jgi:hypothetical protein
MTGQSKEGPVLLIEQLLVAFNYLNVKVHHRPALIDVFINSLSSYEAEKKHKLPTMTVRSKVTRLESYIDSCKAFNSAGCADK